MASCVVKRDTVSQRGGWTYNVQKYKKKVVAKSKNSSAYEQCLLLFVTPKSSYYFHQDFQGKKF